MSTCHSLSWLVAAMLALHAGETFGTEDPRTGEVYAEVAEAQEADVDAAVKAAREVDLRLPALCYSHWFYHTLAMLRPPLFHFLS